MPRNWPDPHLPDKPVSAFEIAAVSLLVVSGYAAMIWGAIQMLTQVLS